MSGKSTYAVIRPLGHHKPLSLPDGGCEEKQTAADCGLVGKSRDVAVERRAEHDLLTFASQATASPNKNTDNTPQSVGSVRESGHFSHSAEDFLSPDGSAAVVSESLDSQPVCPVCLRPPQDPRLLPCLHSLCRICLNQLLSRCLEQVEDGSESSTTLSCPVCRYKCRVSSCSFRHAFPSDFVSRNILLQSSLDCPKVECSMCDEAVQQPVTAQCRTCQVLLCKIHACSHPLTKGSADHIVLDIRKRSSIWASLELDAFQAASADQSPPSCENSRQPAPVVSPAAASSERALRPEWKVAPSRPVLRFDICRVEGHDGEPLRIFCRPCDQFICFECFSEAHMSHDCVSAKSMVEHKRRKIQESLTALREETLPEYEAGVLCVKQELASLTETAKSVREDIHRAVDKTLAEIKTFGETLMQQVTDIEDTRSKMLDIQHEEIVQHIKSMRSAIQFTDNALEHCIGIDLLPVCTLLLERLDELRSSMVARKPCETSSLVFKTPLLPLLQEDIVGIVANSLTATQYTQVTGCGKHRAMPHKTCAMTLIAHDSDGARVLTGGDKIVAKWITRESCDSDTVISLPLTSTAGAPVISVKDLKNGTYSLRYMLKETGTYMLSVSINDEPLPKSPFHIDCSPWCFDADSCSEHILLLSNRREAVKVRGSMNNDFLVGNCPMMFGQHKWRVIINSSPFWVAVGVTKKPPYDSSSCWGWSSVAHQLPEGQELNLACERWQERDVLVLELDCEAHTLQVTNLRSGRKQTISRLPDAELYPWFVLYKQGDSIRIDTDCDVTE